MFYYKFVLSNGSEFEMTAYEASELFIELSDMFGIPSDPSEIYEDDHPKEGGGRVCIEDISKDSCTENQLREQRKEQIKRDNEAIKNLNDFSDMHKRIAENTELEKLAREMEEAEDKQKAACQCSKSSQCPVKDNRDFNLQVSQKKSPKTGEIGFSESGAGIR